MGFKKYHGFQGLYYDQRSDVFSYGIVLCELIARVEADPDELPRTDNFGLDYLAFTELCGPNVVPDFLKLTFRCCTIDPESRPTFTEIKHTLADILNEMNKVTESRETSISSCAAKSEEQLPIAIIQQSCAPQHRKSKYFLQRIFEFSHNAVDARVIFEHFLGL